MYNLNTILREYISANRRYIDSHSNFVESTRLFHNNINNFLRIHDSSYGINSLNSQSSRHRRRSRIPTHRQQPTPPNNSRQHAHNEQHREQHREQHIAPIPPSTSNEPNNTEQENTEDSTIDQEINNIQASLTETISSFINNRIDATPRAIIEQECEIIPFSSIENNTQEICPIDQVPFEENENVMRIRFCGHIFRENNLRENFRYRSTCPVCRHNIITTVTHNHNFNSPTENNIRWFVRY